MTFKDLLNPDRPLGAAMLIGSVVLVITILWFSFAILRPLPPKTVIMATGSDGGTYKEAGVRYRDILAQAGIELQLLSTAGSLENLAMLNDRSSNVSIGLIQGGITNEKESPDLETLGTLFYEPLWIFYRNEIQSVGLDSLKGRRISIGPEGSGTRALAMELLARNGIDQNFAELLPLSPRETAEELLKGKIDAAIFMASWRSPVVRQLLASESIKLTTSPRADAYVALYPYLNKLVVPAGVGDLAKNLPPEDVSLFATKASLVVRKDLHPALKYLLLNASEKINSGPGPFHKGGEFPAAESIDLPLSQEARQFYKSGRPYFQRFLPFWLAVQVDRLLIIIIPLIGLMYPLLRFMPFVYDWSMRRRIYRLYGELWLLEHELESSRGADKAGDLNAKLDRLEEKADRLRLPKAYVDMLYKLKEHVILVRERLNKDDNK
jgi:TRAP transporter TAXI family solute receptor